MEETKGKNKKEIKECILQQIWVHQFFTKKKKLKTTNNENLEILSTGQINFNSGPDFINACIIVNGEKMNGDIEIHRKASYWNTHKHNNNPAYDNVILHVVMDNDKEILNNKGGKITTLSLAGIVSEQNLNNIISIFKNKRKLCGINDIPAINYENLVIERTKRKINFILKLLDKNKGDWRETFLQFLFYNFGFKINNQEMLLLARTISYKIIDKNKNDKNALLALLLGQAGLIEKTKNNKKVPFAILKPLYLFLKTKYNLPEENINWHFSRLRPRNSPVERIFQLVEVFYSGISSFEQIINTPFGDFNKKDFRKKTPFSKETINNILINIVFPLQNAYKTYMQKNWEINYQDLKNINAEKNNIISKMKPLVPKNAYESQGLIELYNNHCQKKECLNCPYFR